MDKDFQEELIEERTALNSDFPKILDEAWQERVAQQEELPRGSGSTPLRRAHHDGISETNTSRVRAMRRRKRQAQS